MTGSVSRNNCVDSGATLGGTAVINGVLNISTGGTLSPGIDKNGKIVADTPFFYSGSNLIDLGENSDTVETMNWCLMEYLISDRLQVSSPEHIQFLHTAEN